jgi:leucyl-tRNA synthetase
MEKYDFQKVQKYWQSEWDKNSLYVTSIKDGKDPFYNLWMFPYPSAEGLHAGHAYASTGSDIYGRYMRMHGKTVFQPIGYDSFGIHSENFALKIGQHPEIMLQRTSKNYERQLRSLGHGYDWTRTVATSNVDYYKWTQWIFVKLFEAGLAYQKKANVNWCPSCKTVLADEQVIDGKCERCQSVVEKKQLMQWFFRITDYADRLLANLEKIDWPEKIKTAQRNWIGKSEGNYIEFTDQSSKIKIKVFTTRVDTLHGATFLALAPNHPQVIAITPPEKRPEIDSLGKPIGNQGDRSDKNKIGVYTGTKVINPATGKEIPVWIVNYVTADYGTGAIMGVPSHDLRDREFASKYGIDIEEMEPDSSMSRYGNEVTNYHLRDWLISRQRYWGPPIPMIFCSHCASVGKSGLQNPRGDWENAGWYSVPVDQLPVVLPHLEDYQPDGSGRGPLEKHPEFFETICPSCGKPAKRETDVSDTFLDSAWYFLRYPSVGAPHSDKVPFESVITKKWLPVNLYFGGAEHAVLHLMYARFVTMVLKDLKLVDFEEPFPEFYAHGLMIKDGAKMSKSRGNVVNPDQYVEKFGADAFRLYLMFIGPMDGSPDFRDSGMEGMARFVNRIINVQLSDTEDGSITVALNVAVEGVTADIDRKHYNTAIAKLMELTNHIEGSGNGLSRAQLQTFSKLLAPFAPYLAEELFHKTIAGNEFISVHTQDWPKYDPTITAKKSITMVVQVNGAVRDTLVIDTKYSNDQEYISQLSQESAKIKNRLNGAKFRTIFVPGKVINFVTE